MQHAREEYKCIIKLERELSLGSLKHGYKDNINNIRIILLGCCLDSSGSG
jgi:hypothetical protein